MDAALRRNDALEHTLLWSWLNASTLGLCVVDDTSRVVMINATAGALFGIDAAQALNLPVGRLFRRLTDNVSLMQWLATPGFDGERQVAAQGPHGALSLLIKTQSVPGPDAQRFKVITLTDITELMAARSAIDDYNRQFAAMSAGVVVVDAGGDMPIRFVNPAFEKMTGYSADEVVGRNCRFLQGAHASQPALESIRRAVRDGTNGYARLKNFRKDGTPFLNELFISPVKSRDGVVTHFIGVQHLRDEAKA